MAGRRDDGGHCGGCLRHRAAGHAGSPRTEGRPGGRRRDGFVRLVLCRTGGRPAGRRVGVLSQPASGKRRFRRISRTGPGEGDDPGARFVGDAHAGLRDCDLPAPGLRSGTGRAFRPQDAVRPDGFAHLRQRGRSGRQRPSGRRRVVRGQEQAVCRLFSGARRLERDHRPCRQLRFSGLERHQPSDLFRAPEGDRRTPVPGAGARLDFRRVLRHRRAVLCRPFCAAPERSVPARVRHAVHLHRGMR